MNKDNMTSAELAAYLNVTQRTIQNWRYNGMPCQKLGYNLVRFDLDEVMEWLRNR